MFDCGDMLGLRVGEGIFPVGADLQKPALSPNPAPNVSAFGEDYCFGWVDAEVGQPELVEYR